MYSYKEVDISFLSFQSQSYKFYLNLIKIKTLLYHSIHQTPEFFSWLEAAATDSDKSFLKKMSRKMLEATLVDFKIYESPNMFFDQYKLTPCSRPEVIPSYESCDMELSGVSNAALAIREHIHINAGKFEENGMRFAKTLESDLLKILLKIENTIGDPLDWNNDIKKVNAYLSDIDDLFTMNYHFAKQDMVMVSQLEELAKKIHAYITHRLRILINQSNFKTISIWTALIDKMILDCHKGSMIKDDLCDLLHGTSLSEVISGNIVELSEIENKFMFFMKGKDENNNINDISKLNENRILKRLGITIESEKLISAAKMHQLGNLILQNITIVPHPLLACEFFELAYLHADHENDKLLAFCQLETAYKIAVSGGYVMSFYDETHIALHQYLKYIETLNDDKMTSSESQVMLLDKIKCQIAKFKIDKIKLSVNNLRDIPNRNLLNILFILEQNDLSLNQALKADLDKVLHSISDMYDIEKIGKSNAEIIGRICINIMRYNENDYPNKMQICCLQ